MQKPTNGLHLSGTIGGSCLVPVTCSHLLSFLLICTCTKIIKTTKCNFYWNDLAATLALFKVSPPVVTIASTFSKSEARRTSSARMSSGSLPMSVTSRIGVFAWSFCSREEATEARVNMVCSGLRECRQETLDWSIVHCRHKLPDEIVAIKA